MASQAELFKYKLELCEIIDPQWTHHEFVSGAHGQKIDFDLIPDDTPLYEDWVMVTANQVTKSYPNTKQKPLSLLGIDKGTNRLANDVASEIGAYQLNTVKVNPREVQLTRASLEVVQEVGGMVLALEDVGTTGGTVYSGLQSALSAGAGSIAALVTWQRTNSLPKLDKAGIHYDSIIHEPRPTYSAEECREIGFCAMEWVLIPHSQ